MNTTAINPFLDGNFAPVSAEITATELQVLGELPTALSGMIVRNGPNPQFPPIGQYHWFDGDGMLHGVQISNGKASYRNRYVQTQKFQIERSNNKSILTGLLEPVQINNPDGIDRNTANTALVYHAHRLLALWEGGKPHEIELPTLETVGSYNYNDRLTSPFTAHPKIDPQTGEMMFFGYSFAQPPFLHYSIVSADGKLLQTVPIDLPRGVMMHDFAITENYTIFMDLPLTFSIERMQKGEPPLLFENNLPSRFGILPRHENNSSIRWFEAPSCYVFHTLNAYELGDEIILIACRMKTMNLLNQSTPDAGNRDHIPSLYRWQFNLNTGEVKEEQLDDIPSDFPRINEQFLGRNNRYGYAALMAHLGVPLFEGIIKYDFITGKSQTHQFGNRRYGGEAVFVPNPIATNEDDGWLMTFVYDETQECSELVIVNAQDITSEPIARVILPQRVPYGFHATWIS